MSTSTRPRSTLLLSAALLVTASLHPPPPAAAGPYEIRAEWSGATDRLTPAGVDFAFDAIEHVPRFGVLLYGSHLLLRIEHGEPFVTLGAPQYHHSGLVSFGAQGVGLGLTIARLWVRLHGGSLHAGDPPRGPGTCMTARLPRKVPAAEEPEPAD